MTLDEQLYKTHSILFITIILLILLFFHLLERFAARMNKFKGYHSQELFDKHFF